MTSYLWDLGPVPSFQLEIGQIEPWSLVHHFCHIQCSPPGDATPHHVPFIPSAQAIHALEHQDLRMKYAEDPESLWRLTRAPLPHHCRWVEIICCHLLAPLKQNTWAWWGHKGKRKPIAIPVELEVQWWMSLTISSPRRGSCYLTFSPGPIQLSHFCQIRSIVVRVLLSILTRPDLVGDLQGQVEILLQVLSYMDLQNLKTEVDQSLEPGRDHSTNEETFLRAAGNTWEDFTNQCSVISWCRPCIQETTWNHLCELFWYNRLRTVSAKDYMGTVSISNYCLLFSIS